MNHSCISQHVQDPKSPGIIFSGLALFSPGYVGVSNSLGLIVWRIHVHLWHQTENTELGLTAREKDVVRLVLAVKDQGLLCGKPFPGSPSRRWGAQERRGDKQQLREHTAQWQGPGFPAAPWSGIGWAEKHLQLMLPIYYLFALERILALHGRAN